MVLGLVGGRHANPPAAQPGSSHGNVRLDDRLQLARSGRACFSQRLFRRLGVWPGRAQAKPHRAAQ